MNTTLGELLKQMGLTSDVEEDTAEEVVEIHRVKGVVQRPTEEINLEAVWKKEHEIRKTQKDPTEDLVILPVGLNEEEFKMYLDRENPKIGFSYLVFDTNTFDTYFCHDKLCLDANFIYRDDLEITDNVSYDWYKIRGGSYAKGLHVRKSCYILDNPANETYEVYYETAYPTRVYGLSTPQGTFVHKYKNRFHRDMAILELDKLYSESSKKDAKRIQDKKLKSDEAIIVSDGAWLREVSSNAFWYIDNKQLTKMVNACLPSEPDQAVLISEINGAYNAIKMCVDNHKKRITYYYDNTSIVNVFKNRKTEYIEEVKRYKDFLMSLFDKGINIKFVELHPKTGENRDSDNKALTFFHNICDNECRNISEIFTRKYIQNASANEGEGTSLNDLKQQQNKQNKGGKGNWNKNKR